MSGQLKLMVQIGTPRLVQVCMHVCMMVIDLSVPGAHELLEVAKEHEVVVVLHTSQTFALYGKRPLRKSARNKLAFVWYRKGLPYKV